MLEIITPIVIHRIQDRMRSEAISFNMPSMMEPSSGSVTSCKVLRKSNVLSIPCFAAPALAFTCEASSYTFVGFSTEVDAFTSKIGADSSKCRLAAFAQDSWPSESHAELSGRASSSPTAFSKMRPIKLRAGAVAAFLRRSLQLAGVDATDFSIARKTIAPIVSRRDSPNTPASSSAPARTPSPSASVALNAVSNTAFALAAIVCSVK
mmetsp:Transcript_57974/g.92113  ORF Transcript_57974/g.92113 Transcript_57974/m.92113 type:complete len:208 (-) Transcript_57974:182-805(-)